MTHFHRSHPQCAIPLLPSRRCTTLSNCTTGEHSLRHGRPLHHCHPRRRDQKPVVECRRAHAERRGAERAHSAVGGRSRSPQITISSRPRAPTYTNLSAANFPHKASSCANAELIELFSLDYSRHRIVDHGPSKSAINGPRRLRGGLQTADIKYVGGAA